MKPHTPRPPRRPRSAPARKHRWLTRSLSLGLIAALVVCGLAFGLMLIAGQAAGGSPIPSGIAASLEEFAVQAGLIQPAPPPRATSTPSPPVVYLEPLDLPKTLAATDGGPRPSPGVGVLSETVIQSPIPPATAGASSTESETSSPSPTVTPSWTITVTQAASLTPPGTLTEAPVLTSTSTRTRTPTPTRTPTRTPTTPAPTSTEGPTSAATATTSGTAAPTATPVTPAVTPEAGCDATGNEAYESTLLDLINEARANQGLPAYSLSSHLRSAARSHSADMACNDYLSHTGSDGSSVGERVSAEGYDWSWVGENIFATSSSSSSAPQQAFDWWMNSTGHKANILNVNFTEIGIGYMYRADSTYGSYFTAVFARP